MPLTKRCFPSISALCLWTMLCESTMSTAEVTLSVQEQALSIDGEIVQHASTVLLDEKDEPTILDSDVATPLECGIWLAPSAIENAGLGMYAGRNFSEGDYFQEVGDLCIPIVDIRQHNGQQRFEFLWDQYTWTADAIGAQNEGFHEVNGASPGFGSAANSFLPLVNVDELTPHQDYVGLNRKVDPGAGAFTPYYDRGGQATRDIAAGEELYVSYGEAWFRGRSFLGIVPLTKDLTRATKLFKGYLTLKEKLELRSATFVLEELWKKFVQQSAWNDTSRVFGSFHHHNPEELKLLEKNPSLKDLRIQQATRTQEWLQEYGTCGDHLRAGNSTIRQAGHGAFASRDLPKGTIVAHLPLIHITNRSRLDMFHLIGDPPALEENAEKRPPQLLLNYCYGHGESSLLLCPYGPMVNYVNHNQSLANVKLQWSDAQKGNMKPELLSQSISTLEKDKFAKLAFEFVATKHIAKDEEVFLDYGDAWELAWQQHVQLWSPVEGAEDYHSADDWNALHAKGEVDFMSVFDEMESGGRLYPPNLDLTCNNYFSDNEWKEHYLNGTLDDALHQWTESSAEFWDCEILRTDEHSITKEVMYTVEAHKEDDESDKSELWENIPKKVFRFVDKPYHSDIHLENAFRHDIRIPDSIFPEIWRNLAKGDTGDELDDDEEEFYDSEDGEEEEEEED